MEQRTLIGAYISQKNGCQLTPEQAGEIFLYFMAASEVVGESDETQRQMGRFILLQSKKPAQGKYLMDTQSSLILPDIYFAECDYEDLSRALKIYIESTAIQRKELSICSYLFIGDYDFCAYAYELLVRYIDNQGDYIHFIDANMIRYIFRTEPKSFHFLWRDKKNSSTASKISLLAVKKSNPSLSSVSKLFNPVTALIKSIEGRIIN